MRWRNRPDDAPADVLDPAGPFVIDVDHDGRADLVYPSGTPGGTVPGTAGAGSRDGSGTVEPAWGTPPVDGSGNHGGTVPGTVQDRFPEPRGPGSRDDDGWSLDDEPEPSGTVPIYADVTVRDTTDVRPILPAWAKSKEGIRGQAAWWFGLQWHRTRFHTVRIPLYLARICGPRWVRGLGRALLAWRLWAFDAVAAPVEQVIASQKSPDVVVFMRLREQRSERTRARLLASIVLAFVAALVLVPALVMVPLPWLVPALLPLLAVLAYVGTDRDAPLVPQAIHTFHAPKVTAPIVERALLACDIKQITAALAPGGMGIEYPSEIQRDGNGYRVEVDLPHGVTPSDVAERRQKLASGLRRPLGAVWVDGDGEVHEGRMIIRVLDQDFAKAKPPAWPVAKRGRHDYFKPYVFGWDVTGKEVSVCLFELNMLVGAMMGQGKSATLRAAMLAASLDPTVQLGAFELLGKGDFEDLEGVLHAYVNGQTDDDIRRTADAIHDLRLEVERRTAQLGKVPRDMKPDKKVTREIANHKPWRMHPIVYTLDEAQNAFTHKEYGAQIADDCEFIIKSGRAVAVTLLIGTQLPDAKSIPPSLTRLSGLRFCLKVMGHVENDMILGTGMHRNGYRANNLRSKVDAGIGILVGATDVPTFVKSVYVDGPAAKKIAQRARDLRERAGTITGYAAGIDLDDVKVTVVSVAQDVRAVFRPGETALWNQVILPRLRVLRPGHYDEWTEEQITKALKAAGVERAGRQVERMDELEGRRRNRNGVHLEDLMAALPSAPDDRSETPSGLATAST